MLTLRSQMVLALFAANLISCQRTGETSKVNTLDNFAKGGPLTLHECFAATPWVHPRAPKEKDLGSAKLYKEFVTALGAVPRQTQFAFFEKPNFGVIEFYDDLDGKCIADEFAADVKAAAQAEGAKKNVGETNVGCWVRNPRPTIRLKRDATALRYATVRQFGYVWAELQSSFAFSSNKPVVDPNGDALHNGFKTSLALAFLRDVDQDPAQKGYSLTRFKNMGIPDALLQSQKGVARAQVETNQRKIWNQWGRDQARTFANRVAVETYHSYYCNKETRDSLHDEFPAVAAIFELEAPAIVGKAAPSKLAKGTEISAASCGYGCRNQASLAKFSQADFEQANNKFYTNMKNILHEQTGEAKKAKEGFGLGLFDGFFSMFGSLSNLLFGGALNSSANPLNLNSGNSCPFSGGSTNGSGVIPSGSGSNPYTGGGATPFGGDTSTTPPISGGGSNPYADSSSSGAGGNDEQIVLQETNKYRTTAGAKALQLDANLSAGCLVQVQLQAKCGLKHVLDEACVENSPSAWRGANAENIAQGQPTAQMVATEWYNSEGHRANMLNGAFGRMGLARFQNQWCQRFAP